MSRLSAKGTTLLAVLALMSAIPKSSTAQVAAAEPFLIPYSLPKLVDGSVDFGDFDRDGDLDLVVTGLLGEDNPITRIYTLQDSVYTTNVGGAFVSTVFKVYRPIQSIVNNVWQGAARWGDFDGDGDDDVLLIGLTIVERVADQETIETVGELYRNDNGLLVQTDLTMPGLYTGDVAWGDMDNDGDLDFAACGATRLTAPYAPRTEVFENTPSGFVRRELGLPGVMLCSLAWGDMDGDDVLELAVSGQSDSGIVSAVYRQDGGPTLSAVTEELPDLVLADLGWADYDGDGLDDLLAAGGVLDPALLRGTVTLLRSNGTSLETVPTGDTPGAVAGSVAWGDYDADGDPDIVITGSESVLGAPAGRVLLNNNGEFRSEYIMAGLTLGDLAVGDYNNDGDLDILVIGQNDTGQPFTLFLMNRTFPEILPPELNSGR